MESTSTSKCIEPYIKWNEQYYYYLENDLPKNKKHWDHLDQSGLCIDLVDAINCCAHTEQHPFRTAYTYRPTHKYTSESDLEVIGHGGDGTFMRDFMFVLKEKLEQITVALPERHFEVKFTIFLPDKKSIKFHYDKSCGFDDVKVYCMLINRNMLFDILINDRIKLTVDIDHSSFDCFKTHKIM